MRDIALFALLAVALVYSIRQAWIGAIAWTVVSIMNPHTYGYAVATFPVAASIAVATMLGILIAPASAKRFPWSGESITLIALMAFFCVTLVFAFNIAGSFDQFKKVMKIDFMLLIALYLLHDKRQIHALCWALVVSIGFYGVKGGLFTIATGGAHRVWGPQGTYIEGNNEVALAIILVIPLVRYLQMQTKVRWQRLAYFGVMGLMAAAALGSHSRGALLAILAMAMLLWWRSKGKLLGGMVIGIAGATLLSLMSDQWFQRMETIGEYQEDASAMGRINAWYMAWNLATNHLFGGGFDIYNAFVASLYAPDPTQIRAAHSIYFQVLGEHGFIGLALFLLLYLFTWMSAGVLRKTGSQNPETQWVRDLGAMCQVSLAGYLVGGAFLSLAYFDLPYNIMILVVATRVWLERNEQKPHPSVARFAKGVGRHVGNDQILTGRRLVNAVACARSDINLNRWARTVQ
jgi:putative inorganic carbon (HCO3(-)) transporter